MYVLMSRPRGSVREWTPPPPCFDGEPGSRAFKVDSCSEKARHTVWDFPKFTRGERGAKYAGRGFFALRNVSYIICRCFETRLSGAYVKYVHRSTHSSHK